MSDSPDLTNARRFAGDADAFRALVEGIPIVSYVDPEDEGAQGIYISPQVEQMLGYAAVEWLSDPGLWQRVLHVDDRDRVRETSERASETGEAFAEEYRMHARDGREVWIRDEAVLVPAHDGYPDYWRGIMLDITQLKRAESKLQRSLDALRRASDERQMLLTRLEEARETERKDIAADIHDDSIQVMSAASLRLQMLLMKVPEELKGELGELNETVTEAIMRLRHLVFELRPVSLDSEGLAVALDEYLTEMGREAGFTFRVHDRLAWEPAPEPRTVLYRMAQETLVNVRKHAHARYVEVFLETEGDGVRVRISDDGRGFDVIDKGRPVPGHLGLAAMRERVELVGGELQIDSAPGTGTIVEFWLPAAPEGTGGEPTDADTAAASA